MTVEELIEKLKALPPEMPVLIQVYGDAFNDIGELRTQKVVELNHSEDRYDALNHIQPDPQFSDEESRDSAIEQESEICESDLSEAFSAVVIRGQPRN